MSRLPALLLGSLLAACTTASPSGITRAELQCPPDSTLTYSNFGEALIADNCLTCHTTRDKPRLTTADDVRANREAIISAAVVSTAMPKSGTLSEDERALLGEWLTCGAP